MTKNVLLDVVNIARRRGADNVDILLKESSTMSVAARLGKIEKVEQADVVSAQIRISVGNSSVIASADNINKLNDDSFIEKMIVAAKNSPEDEGQFRPEESGLCAQFKSIDMYDQSAVSVDQLTQDALECEELALSTAGITNSEGSEASHTRSTVTLVRNNAFLGQYQKTMSQKCLVILAESNGELQRDYDFAQAVYYSDLKSNQNIATDATRKTLQRLGAKKIPSCKVPVIFEKRIAGHVLGNLMDAVNGAAIAKGISFLKDKLGEQVFSQDLSIVDKYAIDRGLRSRPFDHDCLECQDTYIVKDGVLESFLLNTKYANQLGMKSTRNAVGFNDISPNNVIVENGTRGLEELVSSVSSGIFVTEVMGNGLNMVTGNYSQGAAGFWIENGQLAYPIHEITIAGNFIDMLAHCEVANDRQMLTGIDAPTLLIEEMIIGGI